MKQALARYIVETNQQDDYPEPCVDTCLKVLPYLVKMVPRWKVVHKENFHPNTFAAHQAYLDQMRNTLKSKRELKGMVKDALHSLMPGTVSEHGGDSEDEEPEIKFLDDDHVLHEAMKTP